MGLFRSRATPNTSQQLFHSSGVADNESIGSTSAESFEKRQHIDRSRRLVGGYRDAGIVHTYRQEARGLTSEQSNTQDVQNRPKSSMIIDQPTSRVRTVSTSRIDVVKPSSRAHGTATRQQGVAPARPAPVAKRTFMEPVTRRYNPYQ